MIYMKFFMIIFFTVLCFFERSNAIVDPVLKFAEQHLNNLRKKTFIHALNLLEKSQAKIIVETGTARFGSNGFYGDGASTLIFGYWSFLNHAHMYSVDVDKKAVEISSQAVREYADYVHIIQNDSIDFLKKFSLPIDFLYLDSFDFDIKNPGPSQLHHLKEIEAAYDKLVPGAIVMIDDCKLPHGGKGKLVIEFLLKKGWTVLDNEYQVILARNLSK